MADPLFHDSDVPSLDEQADLERRRAEARVRRDARLWAEFRIALAKLEQEVTGSERVAAPPQLSAIIVWHADDEGSYKPPVLLTLSSMK
jgi:hypothetical protein